MITISSGPRRSTYITNQRVSLGHPSTVGCNNSNKLLLSRDSILCEICEAEVAIGRCSICGRWACSKHLINGVCAICRELMCRLCGKNLAVDSCLICGALVCRSCSVELQPGIRICTKCYSRLDELISKEPRLKYVLRYLKKRKDI